MKTSDREVRKIRLDEAIEIHNAGLGSRSPN